MSNFTPNNPAAEPDGDPGMHEDEAKYELITGYIDNQLDPKEAENVKRLIETDNNYYNRYIFEKLAKENLRKKLPNTETPLYVYQSVGKSIDDYIKRASVKSNPDIPSDFYTQQMKLQKSNLRKYLAVASVVFLFLIGGAFLLNSYLKNSELDNDFVSVSRSAFEKLESGQTKLQYNSSSARDLADSMDKSLDFKVFVPDVKDAVLVGGTCNEIHGEKFAHIVHKKGNIIIYTLQANKNEVMGNNDDEEICLSGKFKENVIQGMNWFPCLKDKNKTAVIWYKDNVICSTVADMDSEDIAITLTNYK